MPPAIALQPILRIMKAVQGDKANQKIYFNQRETMRQTKQKKAQCNINRLANIFQIPSINITVGQTQWGTNGTYHASRKEGIFYTNLARTKTKTISHIPGRIIISQYLSYRDSLETQAHEFGHYLDDIRNDRNDQGELHCPPISLPEVREAMVCVK